MFRKGLGRIEAMCLLHHRVVGLETVAVVHNGKTTSAVQWLKENPAPKRSFKLSEGVTYTTRREGFIGSPSSFWRQYFKAVKKFNLK